MWQDIDNLAERPTEQALREALSSPDVSSAVLWITPEVEHSDWIRRLEVPAILERARTADGFFVVPVCAGGLGYSDAGVALDSRFSLEDLRSWNIRRVDAEQLGADEAAAVASRVLSRRIPAIGASRDEGDPVSMYACSRSVPPAQLSGDLVLDWRHHFETRHAKDGAWNRSILPATKTVVDALLSHCPQRPITCEGLVPLAGGMVLGAALLQPLNLQAEWRQHVPGAPSQTWALSAAAEKVELLTSEVTGELGAEDVAVLLSVNANVEPGFQATRESLPEFRTVMHVHGPDKKPFHLHSPGHALSTARYVLDAIKALKVKFRYTGTTHLFMAGPVGLAFLIGQLANQLMPLQTYEFDPEDEGGRYRAAAMISQTTTIIPV